ncbi:hypothetical protein [Roseimaritima ulvae]|uniref:Uncharacterized protein n=1 Tax=Roseimaritima ulvae TaxID=980254 RepID=A0A5B9QYI6_9BACT|nr:hypothetical protein [Roseimaritima ulvae]QEG39003.1 hypothetical protein UC8_09640 [Roseimaritima ulvae]
MSKPLQSILLAVAAVAVWATGGVARAQQPGAVPQGNVHYLFNGQMPPGVVGAARLQRRGAVQSYYQPVRFSGPAGVRFAMAENGFFPPTDAESDEHGLHCGLLVGAVYRFKVTGIPQEPGRELFPTIEIIDRTYPPPGQAHRFPIPVNLETVDLTDALQGRMVTRVIYLEDPQTALPLAETPDTARSFNVMTHQDPLQVADQLGRPVAILRIGSMSPPTEPALRPQFFFGGPPWVAMQPPRSEAMVPAGEGVTIRTPHIPRDDVPAPMHPGADPRVPTNPASIARPYGYGPATMAPVYQR